MGGVISVLRIFSKRTRNMSLFDSSSDFGTSGGGVDALGSLSQADRELQNFITLEQEKAKFQLQVFNLNDQCWDVCLENAKLGPKLDGKSETCIVNCVERFIDSSLHITNRFSQLIQKQG